MYRRILGVQLQRVSYSSRRSVSLATVLSRRDWNRKSMVRTRSPATKLAGQSSKGEEEPKERGQPEDQQPLKGTFSIQHEEVEVKLRIPDSASFAAVKDVLLPSYKITHDQENHFFDGAQQELSSQKVVLRVRFYGGDQKAVITCKGKQVLKGGIGRAPEEEEEVDPGAAREFLKDPNALLTYEGSPLMDKLKQEFKFGKGLQYLGGFDNKRMVYDWRGFTLEVDQTSYPWGCMYEIECETETPEQLKESLEAMLTKHNIPFEDSQRSKFQNFLNKSLI
jgi:adenylate cyclase class IV